MTTKITKLFILIIIIFVLGVCVVVFMRIDAFKKIVFSMKGGYLRIFMSTDTFKNYF